MEVYNPVFLFHSALHCLQPRADGKSLGTIREHFPQADHSMHLLLLVSQARVLVMSGLRDDLLLSHSDINDIVCYNTSLPSYRWQPKLDERG